MFDSYRYPTSIRYDGGPHFRNEFKEMLKELSIPETLSSAYNHASNGLAERHVGVVKLLPEMRTSIITDGGQISVGVKHPSELLRGLLARRAFSQWLTERVTSCLAG